jgi:hypothetical protein
VREADGEVMVNIGDDSVASVTEEEEGGFGWEPAELADNGDSTNLDVVIPNLRYPRFKGVTFALCTGLVDAD